MSHFREDLAKIGEETAAILNSGSYKAKDKEVDISLLIEEAVKNSIMYRPQDFPLPDNPNRDIHRPMNLRTTNETTLGAARRLVEDYGQKVLALNFASARTPGGGWLSGAPAQEESLARASALVPTIAQHKEMYGFNNKLGSALYSDYMIYSPDVPVFRNDMHTLLAEPYLVSFVTSPAPNLGALLKNAPQDAKKVDEVMKERIAKILQIARYHGYSNLVLGAFGCGVFKNNPYAVANHFRAILRSHPFMGAFDEVVFAVYDRTPDQHTYKVFKSIIG